MWSVLGAPPRGLAARMMWLGFTCADRLLRAAGTQREGSDGTMEASDVRAGDFALREGTSERPARDGKDRLAARASDGGAPIQACGISHTGRRERNEDRHLVREDLGLVIVADGFGGEAGGDIAARIAVDEIASCFGVEGEEQTLPNLDDEDLREGMTVATVRFALDLAHRRIRHDAQQTGPLGMRCAAAVALLAGREVVIGHAGSTRAYRFRQGELLQLTRAELAPHTAGLGAAQAKIRTEVRAHGWEPADVYLLCTSGLCRALSDERIRAALSAAASPREIAIRLIGQALHAGAAENLTAVVMRPFERASVAAVA
jgi:protein phosphatase